MASGDQFTRVGGFRGWLCDSIGMTLYGAGERPSNLQCIDDPDVGGRMLVRKEEPSTPHATVAQGSSKPSPQWVNVAKVAFEVAAAVPTAVFGCSCGEAVVGPPGSGPGRGDGGPVGPVDRLPTDPLATGADGGALDAGHGVVVGNPDAGVSVGRPDASGIPPTEDGGPGGDPGRAEVRPFSPHETIPGLPGDRSLAIEFGRITYPRSRIPGAARFADARALLVCMPSKEPESADPGNPSTLNALWCAEPTVPTGEAAAWRAVDLPDVNALGAEINLTGIAAVSAADFFIPSNVAVFDGPVSDPEGFITRPFDPSLTGANAAILVGGRILVPHLNLDPASGNPRPAAVTVWPIVDGRLSIPGRALINTEGRRASGIGKLSGDRAVAFHQGAKYIDSSSGRPRRITSLPNLRVILPDNTLEDAVELPEEYLIDGTGNYVLAENRNLAVIPGTAIVLLGTQDGSGRVIPVDVDGRRVGAVIQVFDPAAFPVDETSGRRRGEISAIVPDPTSGLVFIFERYMARGRALDVRDLRGLDDLAVPTRLARETFDLQYTEPGPDGGPAIDRSFTEGPSAYLNLDDCGDRAACTLIFGVGQAAAIRVVP